MNERIISNKQFQVNALDGLRGIAALIVVASHTSNNGWYFFPYANFSGIGTTGVYLFFILSSFLLTLPLISKGRKIFSAKEFMHYWQRRVFRIFPLYTVYLLTALISTYVIYEILAIKGIGIPFTLTPDEFVNHMLLQEGKSVTWSIAVEFKFYFVLPFMAFILALLSRFSLIITVIALTILIAIFTYLFPSSEITYETRHELMPYMSIFLIGMMMSVIQLKL